MSYADIADVQARMDRTMSVKEQSTCAYLLDDAATIIDATKSKASNEIKALVSIRMVIRALGSGEDVGIPIGANGGSMSGLGFSQSWQFSTGSTGELYINKAEKQMLGLGNTIGSHSPIEDL